MEHVKTGSLNCQDSFRLAGIGSAVKMTAVMLFFIWYVWKCPQTTDDISCINPLSLWYSTSTEIRHMSRRGCLIVSFSSLTLIRPALVSHRWSIRRRWWPWDRWPSMRRGQRSLTSLCPSWRRASAWWCLVAMGPCLLLPSSVTSSFVFHLSSSLMWHQLIFLPQSEVVHYCSKYCYCKRAEYKVLRCLWFFPHSRGMKKR